MQLFYDLFRISKKIGGLEGTKDVTTKQFKFIPFIIGPTNKNMGNTQEKAAAPEVPKVQPKVGKSGKKICCSCPETKKLRDACTLENGPESDTCKDLIEAHKVCLRGEGFVVA